MTPRPRGNGGRRILAIEIALSVDWVQVSGKGRRQRGETDDL